MKNVLFFAALMLAACAQALEAAPATIEGSTSDNSTASSTVNSDRADFRQKIEELSTRSTTQPLVCSPGGKWDFSQPVKVQLRIEAEQSDLESAFNIDIVDASSHEVIFSTLIAYEGFGNVTLGVLRKVQGNVPGAITYVHKFSGTLFIDSIALQVENGRVSSLVYQQQARGTKAPYRSLSCKVSQL
jgi:hypothetical protein